MKITQYIPNVPAGTYDAVVTSVTDKTSKKDGSPFRLWEFTLADGTGRTLSAISSMQTTPNSKAGKWLTAMLGRTPTVGEDIEPVGLRCTIGVSIGAEGYEQVDGVMGASSGNRPAPSPSPAAPKTAPVAAVGAEVADDADLPF